MFHIYSAEFWAASHATRHTTSWVSGMVLTGRYLTVTGGQVIMAAGLKPTPKPTVYNTDKFKKGKVSQ